jgi:aryl-alcohol dehydrogenase-like predicted oxidoreductase
MRIQRRQFLSAAAAGTAGLWLGGRAAPAAPPLVESSAPAAPAAAEAVTAMVRLGKSLKVCRLGCGTGMAGGNRQSNMTRMGREKFEPLLAYSYDQGVRLFDCADLYGTHPFVARAMKGKPRDGYQLVSKIWFLRGGIPEPERPDADVVVKRFLKELDTDYIDVVQMHCMTSPTWSDEMRRQMDIMEKLKKQGLIRAHGVSCHSLPALEAAAAEPWVDVIHARINPFGMRTDVPREQFQAKVMPVLRKAHAAGKGIIAMKLVGEGTFSPEERARSIRFAMESGCVDVLVVGIEEQPQIDELKGHVARNLAAARAKRAAG